MKVRFIESFRIRMMIYTCVSMAAAMLTDFAVLLICVRMGWLVGNYQMNPVAASLYENRIEYAQSPLPASILGENDIFYRMFGVSLTTQLVLLLTLIAVCIFLIVFLTLTRQFTVYTNNVLQGARQMAAGDFAHRIDVLHHDEVSCVADSINQMATMVQEMQCKEQEAEQTKNELITNIAHDLRTPLTSIIGYIDIVHMQTNLTDEQRSEYLKIAWEKSKKLERMINELFSFTKVSYGGMPMNMEKIDLIKLLEQEIDELYPTFEENDLVCKFESEVKSCMIMANGEQLIRVFDNLLGNAIRYGKNGKLIKICTQLEDSLIKVRVINYGSIIPAESLPHLFEKFYKVDAARQTTSEGTGLGLAIAKSIVESHHGTISAKSSFEGTVFEVVLPIVHK